MHKILSTALALACLGGNALAGPVTVPTVSSSNSLMLTGFAYGSGLVDTSLSGVVAAGELQASRQVNGLTESFLTYCTEITQAAGLNTRYTDYTTVTGTQSRAFTSTEADRLGKLYTLAGAAVDTRDESIAFQLAVWEIVHESSSRTLDLRSGSFTIDAWDSNNALALASGWLATISQPSARLGFTAERLYSATAQDFVTFTPVVAAVPEPAGAALAAVALAGLLWSRRHRPQRPAAPV